MMANTIYHNRHRRRRRPTSGFGQLVGIVIGGLIGLVIAHYTLVYMGRDLLK